MQGADQLGDGFGCLRSQLAESSGRKRLLEEAQKMEKEVRSLGCQVMVTDTIMKDLRSKTRLAGVALRTLASRT